MKRKQTVDVCRILLVVGMLLQQISTANAQFPGGLGDLINKKLNKLNTPQNQPPATDTTTTNNVSGPSSTKASKQDAGAPVQTTVPSTPARSNPKRTTVSDVSASSPKLPPLFEAARQCDEAQFAELLKKDMSSINKTADEAGGKNLDLEDQKGRHDYRMYTLLDFAAEKGCTNIIRRLLDLEVDVDPHSGYGFTPLSLAARNGHLEAVKILLKAHADVGFGLHEACVNNHVEVLKTLMTAKGNCDSGGLGSLLTSSSSAGNVEITRIILKEWAKRDSQNSESKGRHLHQDYVSAFRLAIAKGHLDVVKMFVADGADLSRQDESGKTVTQAAIEANQPEMLAYLKEAKKEQDASKAQKRNARVKKNAAEESAKSEEFKKKVQEDFEHPKDVYGLADSRCRKFNGKVYDCAEPIQFLNWKAAVEAYNAFVLMREMQPASLNEWLKERVRQENRKLAEHPWSKVKTAFSLGEVGVDMKVQQVIPDGLIVRLEDGPALIKNHPKQKMLVDGDSIGALIFALKGNPYQYKDVLGATRTIRAYDFGVVVSPPSGLVAKFPIPE